MVTWEVITQKLKMERDIKENAEREQQKAEEMAKILDQVDSSATTLGSSAEELTAVSQQMAPTPKRPRPRPTSSRPPRSRSARTCRPWPPASRK